MRHFNLEEFDSKTEPGSGARMNKGTLKKIDNSREYYGRAIIVTHAIRTKEDEKRLIRNGYQVAKNSSHFRGFAIDCLDKRGMGTGARWVQLLEAMWKAGFRRFGIMKNAVHVDDDPTKTSPAMWSYSNTLPSVWAQTQRWFNRKRSIK